MKFNLHIENLILDGVGIQPDQNNTLRVAVESALKQQLLSDGMEIMTRSNDHQKSISGGSISIGNPHKTASIGKQIGNAVYGAIGR